MKYLDFDLLIEPLDGRYKAKVISSPAGEAAENFDLPFSAVEIENFLLKCGRLRREGRRIDTPEIGAAKEFGKRLFEAVFSGSVGNCWHQSIDEAQGSDAGLRLRLRLTSVPELANLPWEYLYNPSANNFVALSVKTLLVRYLERPGRMRPLLVKPPLRVLVLISSPADYPKLAVDQEWARLQDALSDLKRKGLVDVEKLQTPNAAALQKCLLRQDFHIFHFIGHGGFDTHMRDGVIIFEDDKNQGRPISAETLGMLLHDAPALRLAILNACEGARIDATDSFSGTAQGLIQKGIPAAIAMQFGITDIAAVTFAQHFYTWLAEGHPIDTALAETRQAMVFDGNDLEWATPVLYMRSPDGEIFEIEHTNRDIDEQIPPNPPDSDAEIFDRLILSQVRLSVLSHLNELPITHQGNSISDIQKTLGMKKRKHLFQCINELATDQLIDKTKKDKHVYWRLSEKGRTMLKKLEGVMATKLILEQR